MGIFQQASLTDLRDATGFLRYGRDIPGGGDSGEPYITTPIPPALNQQVDPNIPPSLSVQLSGEDFYTGFSPLVFPPITNELIRGGIVGTFNASSKDYIRIGKFLRDAPQGPLFIAKQIGLQLSNPQLEAPIGDVLSNLVQGNIGSLFGGGTNSFINIGSTRIYNGGLNTLLQVPINGFGGHLIRHGLLPVDFTPYEGTVRSNNPITEQDQGRNNRLVRLKDKLERRPNANISQYISGPGSVFGIGITTIPRFSFTLNNPQYISINKELKINQEGLVVGEATGGDESSPIDSALYRYPIPNINYYNAQGVSLQYFDTNKDIESSNNILSYSPDRENNLIETNQFNLNAFFGFYGGNKTYNELKKDIDDQTKFNRIGTAYYKKLGKTSTIDSPVQFVFSNTTRRGLNLSKFNIDTRLGLSQANRIKDEVNLTPLYVSEDAPGAEYVEVAGKGRAKKVRDLIKFRIEAVDNDNPTDSTWMIFRAYLKNITDNPNPNWNTVNYVGRGEPFYIYKGFERTVSFTFQVAAMSEAELKPMWQKLNYLYSNTMPDYYGKVMRGPYMKLTIGDYMFRQPGVIKSLTYTITNDTPWEIAIEDPELASLGIVGELYELPHVMEVQMTFAVIHDFVPRKFPTELTSTTDKDGVTTPDWNKLPAFVVDRVDNQNAWLTEIFSVKTNQIPRGTRSNGLIDQPLTSNLTPASTTFPLGRPTSQIPTITPEGPSGDLINLDNRQTPGLNADRILSESNPFNLIPFSGVNLGGF